MMSVHRFCVEHHIVTVNVTFSVALFNYYLDVLPIDLGAFFVRNESFLGSKSSFSNFGTFDNQTGDFIPRDSFGS